MPPTIAVHGTYTASTRRQTNGSSSKTVGHLHSVSTLATMWQRIAGNYAAQITDKVPQNFAVLALPHRGIMRGHNVSDDARTWGLHRDHPFASWSVRALPHGTTLANALETVERANNSTPRAAKFRLNFADGTQLTLARGNVNDADTLECVGVYNPGTVFSGVTQARNTQSRAGLMKKLNFIVDDRGRSLKKGGVAPKRPQTAGMQRPSSPFAPEQLYKDCPPPATHQPGFDFTPVSHISFLMRPNQYVPGCRPSLRSTNPQAIHFRPRSYHRPLSAAPSRHAHCAEVVHYETDRGDEYVFDVTHQGQTSQINGRNSLPPTR